MITEKNAIGFPTESGGFEEIASDAPKASPDGLTAQDVAYGNETVDDALTELNSKVISNVSLGTGIDISSYTASNRYIAPSDGYISINGGNVSSGSYSVDIAGTLMAVEGAYKGITVYVRKGLGIYGTTTNQAYAPVMFYPIVAA